MMRTVSVGRRFHGGVLGLVGSCCCCPAWLGRNDRNMTSLFPQRTSLTGPARRRLRGALPLPEIAVSLSATHVGSTIAGKEIPRFARNDGVREEDEDPHVTTTCVASAEKKGKVKTATLSPTCATHGGDVPNAVRG